MLVQRERTSLSLDLQTRKYLKVLAADRGLKVSPWIRNDGS
jgi:hypothetical protein